AHIVSFCEPLASRRLGDSDGWLGLVGHALLTLGTVQSGGCPMDELSLLGSQGGVEERPRPQPCSVVGFIARSPSVQMNFAGLGRAACVPCGLSLWLMGLL